MGNYFLNYDLEKQYGKEYCNDIRKFKYNFMKHYNIPWQLRKRASSWTISHIIKMINVHYNEKVIIE